VRFADESFFTHQLIDDNLPLSQSGSTARCVRVPAAKDDATRTIALSQFSISARKAFGRAGTAVWLGRHLS
jgi:hypothetical protein